MNQVYSFHKTVRGHLHILNGFPCEDFSASFSSEDGRYHIAIIADGHGAKSCFRSERGSKAVTETAFDCLKNFAEAVLVTAETESQFYNDIFSSPRYCQMTLRSLTDSIIARWYDQVMEDYKRNPPTPEEMGDCVKEYQNGKNITHIYGTTVIAALCLPCCMILMQQGDGRCDIFFEDGRITQPIPWDERCEDTTTTSMCDEDAARSFRTHIVDLRKEPVAACYLGCDGVEDAYRDTYEDLGGSHTKMGGVHTFYKDLTCQAVLKGQADFEAYLDEMLPNFSKNGRFSRSGSGDDVSVAGILDMSVIGQFVEKFQKDVKCYDLEEKLFWKEDELRGKARKYGILQKRIKDTKEEFDKVQKEQENLHDGIQKLMKKRRELAVKLEEVERELLRYYHTASPIQVDSGYLEKGVSMVSRLQSIKNYSIKQGNRRRLRLEIEKQDVKIKQAEKILEKREKKLRELQEKYNDAIVTFDEYDKRYQKIVSDIKWIQDEIAMEKS